MQPADNKDWRDSAFVSLAKAATILGYSVGAIRNMVFNERLRAVRLARSGPMFVTVESILALIDGAEPALSAKRHPARDTAAHPPSLVLIQGGRK
jgi:hypothetical protein